MTNAEAIRLERQRIARLGGKARAKLPKRILAKLGRHAAQERWRKERENR